MLDYIKREVRSAHVTVWWMSAAVTIALIAVTGWSMYQAAHKAPPHAAAVMAIHQV